MARRRGCRLQKPCPHGASSFVGISTYRFICIAKQYFDVDSLSSTRGLDSSTALEFIRALRVATDSAKVTTVVSIYQAGEQLFDLFDKVCLIYEGKMAYFGPAKDAKRHFMDMGYEPQNRQTTPDFLVACTSRDSVPRASRAHDPQRPIPMGGRSVLDSRASYPARQMRWLPISGDLPMASSIAHRWIRTTTFTSTSLTSKGPTTRVPQANTHGMLLIPSHIHYRYPCRSAR